METNDNIERTWNSSFKEYTEAIVAHPNYRGLFYERDKENRVKWVVTGKSEKGKLRQEWWDAKCREHNIEIRKGCYAIITRIIHPTKKHVCQCCGKELSILYEYPSKRLLVKINKAFSWDITQTTYTIKEIILNASKEPNGLKQISNILGLPMGLTLEKAIEYAYSNLVAKEASILSPGVMSNCPDRYDGFHSDGLCCREKTDKGRHKENMKTYTQDRRAYEDWSDGNYNLANRLMGEINKQAPIACPICGKVEHMSADHIGPISLGFCHSMHFAPMCKNCNSSKNNRFTKNDVDELLSKEKSGEQVVSWHSIEIWNLVKNDIRNDADAKLASSIMAKNHQNVLNILSLIYLKTGTEFLMRYLHPEYSLIDYRFENVDLNNLSKITILASPLDSKNKRKNQERYVRIAFESLEEFSNKKNRKNYLLIDENSEELQPIINEIIRGNYNDADEKLKELIKNISHEIYNREKSENTYLDLFDNEYSMVAEP